MYNKDYNLDGFISDDENRRKVRAYVEQMATQMKKGLLNYLVLLACAKPTYALEILEKIRKSGMEVMEGTIYPLLTRMQKDGLLEHTWRESPSGPPRKYYQMTKYGQKVREMLSENVQQINEATRRLEGEE